MSSALATDLHTLDVGLCGQPSAGCGAHGTGPLIKLGGGSQEKPCKYGCIIGRRCAVSLSGHAEWLRVPRAGPLAQQRSRSLPHSRRAGPADLLAPLRRLN